MYIFNVKKGEKILLKIICIKLIKRDFIIVEKKFLIFRVNLVIKMK